MVVTQKKRISHIQAWRLSSLSNCGSEKYANMGQQRPIPMQSEWKSFERKAFEELRECPCFVRSRTELRLAGLPKSVPLHHAFDGLTIHTGFLRRMAHMPLMAFQ